RLDFGQNASGKLELRDVIAPAGHTVTLHHAEVLEADGTLGTRPLRSAVSIDSYTFGPGGAPVTWTPRMTLHGFRYAELEGWPADLDPARHVRMLVVHSAIERKGHFDSSHALLNQFHANTVWGMRGNFVDLPTDCPQRDERLGWTGDIAVFAPAAAYLYDVDGFLRNWLRDVRAEQAADGTMRNYHPFVDWGFPPMPSAGWGDAAVLVPWALYRHSGSLDVLAESADSMCAWIDQAYGFTGGTGHWSRGFTLGDWLDPQAPPDRPTQSLTDKYLVATAYLANSARLAAEALTLLGDPRAERHREIASRCRAAFRANYVTPAGRLVSDTVAAYSLAICFDLLDEPQHTVAGARLAELVEDRDFTVAAGFAAAHLICDALVSAGYVDAAYHLLLQTECPSWLYQVTMGATTVWERWDSMLPDGSINPGDMTSFNHYAYGTVVDFLHRVVAGLAPASPGYAEIEFAPRPGGGLTAASAALDLPGGRASSSWTREGETFSLTVVVPDGHTAVVRLPDGSAPSAVGPGTHDFTCPYRPASADPERPRKLDLSKPADRAEYFRRQAAR
ncbi:MAG: family 78 glycoside hydrolase catalytic domain, partial [Promicromonosporaceae bacterium]|nr:family 78 glycoside hydrolase catalytic domain [Promicromonosporaceae bacterium]